MMNIIQITILIGLLFMNYGMNAQETTISKELLIQDSRELLQIIESVHPDPYIQVGGKIAFHNIFQTVLESIPDTGMSRDNFIWLIQPFVNSIRDGHTTIRHPFINYDPKAPYGMPFWFSVYAEKGLYISKVSRKEFEPLIGSKLITVESLSISDLMKKTRQLFPCQNDYDCLWNLNAMLWERFFLKRFLPECAAKNRISVVIESLNGQRKKIDVDLSIERTYPLIKKQNMVLDLPSTKSCCFAYNFLTVDKKTAFLRIDKQDGFREIIEYAIFHHFDNNVISQLANQAYEQFNNKKAPENIDSLLTGIPSATEVFKNLVTEMKTYGTENLIIDLSRNNGGQSILSQILIYFLYGKNQLAKLQSSSFIIDKLSEYYFEIFTHTSLDEINSQHLRRHHYKLTGSDYNFTNVEERNLILSGEMTTDNLMKKLDNEFKPFTTFYKEYTSGQYNAFYKPKKVIVLCSERTYSAGFGTLVDLYKCGAIVVGTPAGQSANCFGNAVYFKLKNSGADGFISTNYIEMFPGDSLKGNVLMPHYPISFDILNKYHFDPNTIYQYTLDVILKLKSDHYK